MYLSRIEMNARRRSTIQLMSSPHCVHAAVMASFPSYGLAEGRILWRVDNLGPSTYILVQSGARPDFSHIVEHYGWLASGQGWDTVEYDSFLDKLNEGQIRRFRLTANPVHSVKDASSREDRGKVKAYITADYQKKWLAERSTKCGFRIKEAEIDNKDLALEIKSREVKQFMRDGRRVTLNTVTFEGILVVEDSALLRDSMIKGIGRAKGYGCGLMTVAGL